MDVGQFSRLAERYGKSRQQTSGAEMALDLVRQGIQRFGLCDQFVQFLKLNRQRDIEMAFVGAHDIDGLVFRAFQELLSLNHKRIIKTIQLHAKRIGIVDEKVEIERDILKCGAIDFNGIDLNRRRLDQLLQGGTTQKKKCGKK